MPEKSLTLRLALLVSIVFVSAAPVFSQAFYGSIAGTVTDQSNAAVVGATVTLTNTGTGERHESKSGAGGDYQFLNLVPVIYRVDVEQSGFEKAARENVEVTASGSTRANVSMQPGDVTQSIELQAAAPLLQTENANLSQVVTTRPVEELPVNGRNIMNLTALTPGCGRAGYEERGPVTGMKIFAAGNYQIGGGLANQGATYYDGAPANSAVGNLVKMAPSPDAVSEFRVEAELASATGQTTRLDVNLKAGTMRPAVEVAAQAAQIQTGSNAATNATDAQVIPNVTQNPIFRAMLQNGVQPRSETSTSTLRDR